MRQSRNDNGDGIYYIERDPIADLPRRFICDGSYGFLLKNLLLSFKINNN